MLPLLPAQTNRSLSSCESNTCTYYKRGLHGRQSINEQKGCHSETLELGGSMGRRPVAFYQLGQGE